MSQSLSSTDLVERELAQIQEQIHRGLRAINGLQDIQQRFSEFQVVYEQARALVPQAQSSLQKVLKEIAEQQQTWQSSFTRYEQRWQEMEKAWAKTQNDLVVQQQSLTQFAQKLQADNDEQWKQLQTSSLKDQHDLWVAVNNIRTEVSEGAKETQERSVEFVTQVESLRGETLATDTRQDKKLEQLQKDNQALAQQLAVLQKNHQRNIRSLRWLILLIVLFILGATYNSWQPIFTTYFPVVIQSLQSFGIKF